MTLRNLFATGAFMWLTADKEARLVSVSSPAAGVVEIHEMAMDKDVMKMRQVPGLDLAAGRITELKPGGYHVMLMDLKAPVTALGAGNAPMAPMQHGTGGHGGMKH